MTEKLLSIRSINCSYDNSLVLKDFHLDINQGDIACLLGPSGCGKTTALRTIAGLEPIQSGEISLRGSVVSSAGYTLAPENRKLAMVFQDYALFPHLDVTENICFGLKKISKAEKKRIANELLAMLGLEDMGGRYIHELSGGQQQRISLARAMAMKPDLILMDEPFSNLDVELRERLSTDVRRILKQAGISAIIVTHDQSEAFALADFVGVMRNGQIEQWDTPYNIYHEPVSRYVASFVGQGVFIVGELLDPDIVRTEIGDIRGNRAYPWKVGSTIDILLRPDDFVPAEQGESGIIGEVVHKAFRGASILYTLRLASGKKILAQFSSHVDFHLGQEMTFRLEVEHLICFLKS